MLELPSEQEWVEAVAKAKEARHSSTSLHTTDTGAAAVRFYLTIANPRFASLALDIVRNSVINLSRKKKEPRDSVRTKPIAPVHKLGEYLQRHYPRVGEHSAEYDELHRSKEHRELKRQMCRDLDCQCQGCCRHFGLNGELQLHYLDYSDPFGPGKQLLLCGKTCHPIFDGLRRWGMEQERISQCGHGEPRGDCNACDVQSDLMYDTMREQRMFT